MKILNYVIFELFFTNEEMDLIYESYVMAKLQSDPSAGSVEANNYQGQKISASNRASAIKGEERQISSLLEDPTTLYNFAQTVGTSVAGIMAFLSANSDVLTALGIVSQLEAKTQYDPRFRNSIPRVIRDNAPEWIL